MVVEGDGAVWFESARGRFANVVHDGCEAQDKAWRGHGAVGPGFKGDCVFEDGEGVLVNVFVAVVFVFEVLEVG